jgi:hypothetical protein
MLILIEFGYDEFILKDDMVNKMMMLYFDIKLVFSTCVN